MKGRIIGRAVIWIEWPFCCVHHSRDSQCFSLGWTSP